MINYNSLDPRSKKRINITAKRTISYIILGIGGISMALPFLFMLSTSLKNGSAIFTIPPKWIPDVMMWENYFLIFEKAHLFRGLLNTMIITIPTIVVGLFMCNLAGFGFARLNFKGRDKLFTLMLATMMIPGAVLMIPAFIMFRNFGWIDTYKPLMIPGMFGAPMVIFFMRQFYLTLPMELDEAAKMDGMGPLGIFLKIGVPLAKPAIITQAILSFNGIYNDFLGPLIYINTPDKFTLQLELAGFRSYYAAQWHYIMAGSVLALIPTLALFIFAQRYFIEGIKVSGLKG